MKRMLITGFEPFGGQTVNASWEAVKALPDQVGVYKLDKLQLPVLFDTAAQNVIRRTDATGPDTVLMVGQAAGRDALSFEMVGLNLRHAEIADNRGFIPHDMPCKMDGPAAEFSQLPVRTMAAAAAEAGVKARVSYTAGTFVCNDVFYTVSNYFRPCQIILTGFVHVPALPEQAAEGQPSMSLEETVKGLIAAIESLE